MGIDDSALPEFDVAQDTLPPIPGEAEYLAPRPPPGALASIEKRPDLAAARHRVAAVRSTVTGSGVQYAPTLSLSGFLSDAGPSFNQLTWNYGLSIGASWTFFDGLRAESQLREAQANVRSATAEQAGVRQRAQQEVTQARLTLRAALAMTEASTTALRAARERLELAEARYQARVGSALELADAQLAVTNAAAQLIQANFAVSSARALLMVALGQHIR
jgi:outer membrane protein